MTDTHRTDKDPAPARQTPAASAPEAGTRQEDERRLAESADRTARQHLIARGFLFGVGLSLAMMFFVVQNTRTTGLHWLWFSFEARLWIVLLGAFLAGAVASPLLIAAWQRSRRHREEHRVLARKLWSGRKSSTTDGAAPQVRSTRTMTEPRATASRSGSGVMPAGGRPRCLPARGSAAR
jgi:uncharacterized integral membrane protein